MSERLLLHEYAESGNCFKVRLTAALTGVRIDRQEYDIMKSAYAHAIDAGYRFYSYGDASLLLPRRDG